MPRRYGEFSPYRQNVDVRLFPNKILRTQGHTSVHNSIWKVPGRTRPDNHPVRPTGSPGTRNADTGRYTHVKRSTHLSIALAAAAAFYNYRLAYYNTTACTTTPATTTSPPSVATAAARRSISLPPSDRPTTRSPRRPDDDPDALLYPRPATACPQRWCLHNVKRRARSGDDHRVSCACHGRPIR